MQRVRGWASLQTSNGQISGFPTEVDSVVLAERLSHGVWTSDSKSVLDCYSFSHAEHRRRARCHASKYNNSVRANCGWQWRFGPIGVKINFHGEKKADSPRASPGS